MNVQALPEPPRGDAIRGVTGLVAPGGTLLVVAFGADGTVAERDEADGPSWPLVRSEIDALGADGIDLVSSNASSLTATSAGGRPSGAAEECLSRNVRRSGAVGQ